MRYLIPNAPIPPYHLGDLLQVESLVTEILSADKNAEITVFTSHLPLLKFTLNNDQKIIPDKFPKRNRIVNTLSIIPHILDLIKNIKISKAVIFTGGNYLKEGSDKMQFREFLFNLFLLRISNLFAKRKVIMSISFGPFLHKFWRKTLINTLKKFDLILTRNTDSYDELSKLGLTNVTNSFDISLLTSKYPEKEDRNGVCLVISNWSGDGYYLIDQQVSKSLGKICKKYRLKITPVIVLQLDSNYLESEEYKSAIRMIRVLKKYKVKIGKVEVARSTAGLTEIYSNHRFVVGMRLHPILIAITQNIPFLAINRNQKSFDIIKSIGLSDYYLQAHTLSLKILNSKLTDLVNNEVQIGKFVTLKATECQQILKDQIKIIYK